MRQLICFWIVVIIFSGCAGHSASETGDDRKRAVTISKEPFDNLFDPSQFSKISAGSFLMGSQKGNEDERPLHKVRISRDFLLGKFEVTQKQWKRVMGYNPSAFKGENRPVENVSYRDIKEFLNTINEAYGKTCFRLPTEAEWEYACRGGTLTPYATGEKLTSDQANFRDSKKDKRFKETVPVGSYPPNSFGLYDMHGNVWEWCADRYKADFYRSSPEKDPKCPVFFLDAVHVYRGGSWLSSERRCRSSHRFYDTPFYRRLDLGFRLVREL